MKKMLFWIGGVCGAAAGVYVLSARRAKPVSVLAHDLEVAWADHHTVA
jgi:hypothetical protein